MDDDFFPDGAAETVRKVVHFIHHHVAQVFQKLTVGVQHVAQHFCGHDDHLCSSIDARVAGEQADPVCTVGVDKFLKLLV